MSQSAAGPRRLRRRRRAPALAHGLRILTYSLALSPVLTDWLETGHLPTAPREYITEIVIGALIASCVALMQRQHDRLRSIAERDSLTGLYNWRKFTEDLEREVETAHRLGTDLSLVYVDVDAFKAVNDTFGHAMGDAALQATAELLRRAARRRLDACYRIGGDEFALLLIGDGAEGTSEVLQHIAQHRPRAHWNSQRCDIMLSCGAVQLTPHESADAFLRRADLHMYDAKRAAARSADAHGKPPLRDDAPIPSAALSKRSPQGREHFR